MDQGLNLVSSIRIVDSRSVSDHKLVIASLDINPAKPEAIRQTFRNLKNFNASEFESALQRSVLFTDPASTVEEFSSQLWEVVTVELNKVCPLKTRTCRPSNSTSRWLSVEANEAKRNRLKLEKNLAPHQEWSWPTQLQSVLSSGEHPHKQFTEETLLRYTGLLYQSQTTLENCEQFTPFKLN